MSNTQLWKYCTKEQCQDFILSLRLLPGESSKILTAQERRKQLSCLYMLINKKKDFYKEIQIPKKDGGSRQLLVPCGLLKSVQRNILHHVLNGRSISSYACAYHRGRNLCDNAKPHIGRKMILKLDIRHFFDHIIFPQIYGAAFPETLFPPAAAALLTSLCCYQERLVQGAPTSPAISNLVMKPFDEYMGGWCGERGIAYTRYCDDMTFSGDFDVAAVYNKTRSFLGAMGFELNADKTQLIKNGQRQLVTGITVNEKLQVPKTLRRRLRQEIYYIRKFGVEEHLHYIAKTSGQLPEKEHYLASLAGRLQFVLQINPQDKEFLEYQRIWKQII